MLWFPEGYFSPLVVPSQNLQCLSPVFGWMNIFRVCLARSYPAKLLLNRKLVFLSKLTFQASVLVGNFYFVIRKLIVIAAKFQNVFILNSRHICVPGFEVCLPRIPDVLGPIDSWRALEPPPRVGGPCSEAVQLQFRGAVPGHFTRQRCCWTS